MSRKTFVVFVLGFVFGISLLILWQTYKSLLFVRYQADVSIDDLVDSIRENLSVSSFSGSSSDFNRFADIYDVLTQQYYSGAFVDSGLMMQSALKGYVGALGDPYTVYLDYEENASLEETLQGTTDFEGIGAYISKRDQGVLIDEIIKDSPAATAGLKPLDIIVKIGDEITQNMTISQAVEKIRGPAGTKVVLTILRASKEGVQELFEKEVTRNVVQLLSVTHEYVTGSQNEKIGYIAITSVDEETNILFRQSLDELLHWGMTGLILDLRGNNGGLLDASVLIASYFIPKGELVVSAAYRSFPQQDFYSVGYDIAQHLPLVVLVDGLTASAGEIIALALQEQVHASLIGEQTFGKGSIQTIRDFPDKSSLKFTIGKWYAPSGINVHGTGIIPDIIVPFDLETYETTHIDNQLEKAKQELENILY